MGEYNICQFYARQAESAAHEKWEEERPSDRGLQGYSEMSWSKVSQEFGSALDYIVSLNRYPSPPELQFNKVHQDSLCERFNFIQRSLIDRFPTLLLEIAERDPLVILAWERVQNLRRPMNPVECVSTTFTRELDRSFSNAFDRILAAKARRCKTADDYATATRKALAVVNRLLETPEYSPANLKSTINGDSWGNLSWKKSFKVRPGFLDPSSWMQCIRGNGISLWFDKGGLGSAKDAMWDCLMLTQRALIRAQSN